MTDAVKKRRQRQWLIPFFVVIVVIGSTFYFQQKQYNNNDCLSIFSNLNINEQSMSGSNPQNNKDECSCTNIETPTLMIDTSSSFASSLLHPQRTVSDCCCSFFDMEQANLQTVHPLLKRIVQTPFFSHFKIELCSDCKLWKDAPLCVMKDCSVCECEVPPEWTNVEEWMPPKAGPHCEHVDDQVVTKVDPQVKNDWVSEPVSFLNLPNLEERTSTVEDDTSQSNAAVVVDLKLNPEQYTGYSGPSAEKVWNAIHNDNCFHLSNTEGACTLTPAERVYNRIISGLHSSISLHIAHSYCLETDPVHNWECQTWGPNVTLAHERVLGHYDRLENLYVAFGIVLRAVQKAGSAVTAAVPSEDTLFADSLSEWKDLLLPELLRLEHNCPVTFDESSLFSESADDDGQAKRVELQHRFRHLQQIMECVGCDRCKLWGTLQTLGIGTALRVLLHEDSESNGALSLSRQEAVALVHTLERLSSSLVYAGEFSKETTVHRQ